MTLKPQIIIGLSGGVDSAVAAYLLKKQGQNIAAVFMKNWHEEPGEPCHANDDLRMAQAVAEHLEISLKVVDFADLYWERVFNTFLSELTLGRTPNPDILCNKEIKFKAFLDYAQNQGASCIATGHYARTQNGRLLKAKDERKDQSYFLSALKQSQLKNSQFPLGALQKTEVRQLAQAIALPNHARKDSTGICFIGERRFNTFISRYLPSKPGNIRTLNGELIGTHDGLMFYTIGQRQGLKIGGQKGKAELPWYVVKKDIARNEIIIVQGDHPALYQRSLIAKQVEWIAEPPSFTQPLYAKTRYRQKDQACHLRQHDPTTFEVHFKEPQRAITPGQTIVFYQEDLCLGGGIIDYEI